MDNTFNIFGPLYFCLEDGQMIIMIVIGISSFFALAFWACCIAGKRADEAMDKINKKQSEIEG